MYKQTIKTNMLEELEYLWSLTDYHTIDMIPLGEEFRFRSIQEFKDSEVAGLSPSQLFVAVTDDCLEVITDLSKDFPREMTDFVFNKKELVKDFESRPYNEQLYFMEVLQNFFKYFRISVNCTR